MSTRKVFWFPYKPMTVVDAINQRYVATGSPQRAMQGAFADFNGHRVGMNYNDHRKYWISEYTWAGRNVIARGSFDDVLHATASFFKADGKGASALVGCLTEEQAEKCRAAGMVPWSPEIEKAHWESFAWWGGEISNAMSLEKWMGSAAVHILATSKSLEEYQARLDKELADQRARKAGGRS